jgi:hypothetical protein
MDLKARFAAKLFSCTLLIAIALHLVNHHCVVHS